MFLIGSGRVFLDRKVKLNEEDISYFESCVKIEAPLFPEYFELDPIDAVSYILNIPSVAKMLSSGEVKLTVKLDKINVFQHVESNLMFFRELCWLSNDLRSRGWFLRRGTNYGADFLLYESNPNHVHSKYAVYLIDSELKDQWSNILVMNRVCVNAKKIMLLAVRDPNCESKFKYIEMKRWIPESNRE